MNQRESRMQSWALFVPEIKNLLEQKEYAGLKTLLAEVYPIDLAELWSGFDDEEKLIMFKLFDPARAVEVFEELDYEDQEFLLGRLEDGSLGKVLDEMASDEKARLFSHLPEKTVKKFLSLMKKEEADKLTRVMQFPPDSAGALTNTDFIDLKADMTARQALDRVQRLSRLRRVENLYAFYVTDTDGRLLGGVSLRKLIAVPPDIKVALVMSPVNLIRIRPDDEQEDVAQLFAKYDLTVAPVVDERNRLIGTVVIDDVVDIVERMNTKEIYEIGKMSGEEGELINYERATVWELIRRRIGWLLALLVLDFLTGTVLKTYEHSLSSVVALAFFIPMLLDTGGNAGAQTSISIIRGLATGDVTFANAWRVARLEIRAAFVMGLSVGAMAFLRAALLLKGDLLVASVVGSTMTLIVFLAIATGITLPLLSKKVGLDPAVLAGPITTSVVDICGLIIYFKIAQAIIPVLQAVP